MHTAFFLHMLGILKCTEDLESELGLSKEKAEQSYSVMLHETIYWPICSTMGPTISYVFVRSRVWTLCLPCIPIWRQNVNQAQAKKRRNKATLLCCMKPFTGLSAPQLNQKIDGFKHTNKNILDNSYQIVTHFPDFPLWENRIAYFK